MSETRAFYQKLILKHWLEPNQKLFFKYFVNISLGSMLFLKIITDSDDTFQWDLPAPMGLLKWILIKQFKHRFMDALIKKYALGCY